MTDQISYDLGQAAKLCGVSRDTLLRAIAKGDLRAKRSTKREEDNLSGKKGDPAGKHLVTRDALVAWFDSLEDA